VPVPIRGDSLLLLVINEKRAVIVKLCRTVITCYSMQLTLSSTKAMDINDKEYYDKEQNFTRWSKFTTQTITKTATKLKSI